MSNYYYLVAGLPDVAPDDARLPFGVAHFRDEVLPLLKSADRKLLDLFYLQFDNALLLQVLQQKADADTTKGLFSREELEEAVRLVQRDEECDLIPHYMKEFIRRYADLKENSNALAEDVLTGYYYDYACHAKNSFVREWFEFCRDVNNVLIAFTARRYGFKAEPFLIGQGELVRQLASSAARDFGIGTEFEAVHTLATISESNDPVWKERKLDRLKWDWLEEHSFFFPFSAERLFAFVQQLHLVERWTGVDHERGARMFRQLIDGLKNQVEVPHEFCI